MEVLTIKEDIIASNHKEAQVIRAMLDEHGTYLVNLMASPGAGKTSTILQLAQQWNGSVAMGVIEGDIDSMVDSYKVKEAGLPAVQIETGGACHLDVPMVMPALKLLDLDALDVVIVENIGNLVCPAEFDIGADLSAMILSVPEGDDKILKYPLMFSICDLLIVNKTDFLALPSNNFDTRLLRERMSHLNPNAAIFEVSAYTGEGFADLAAWLKSRIEEKALRTAGGEKVSG